MEPLRVSMMPVVISIVRRRLLFGFLVFVVCGVSERRTLIVVMVMALSATMKTAVPDRRVM